MPPTSPNLVEMDYNRKIVKGKATTEPFLTLQTSIHIIGYLVLDFFPESNPGHQAKVTYHYTLSEVWSGVDWADLVAAHGAFGTYFYDRSIVRPKHRAYNRSRRPVIKIGPKGAVDSHEIRPIHSAPSLGQSIPVREFDEKSSWHCAKIGMMSHEPPLGRLMPSTSPNSVEMDYNRKIRKAIPL